MNWYLKVLKQYAEFSGRSRRSEFWNFILYSAIIYILLFIIGSYFSSDIATILAVVYGTFTLVPFCSVSIRRLHDINKSGWYFLLHLIPVVGTITVFYLNSIDSEIESNTYGRNPKRALKHIYW